MEAALPTEDILSWVENNMWEAILFVSMIAAGLFVLNAALMAISRSIFSLLEIKRQKSNGRFMEGVAAANLVQSGIGILILNKTNIPGRWWYYDAECVDPIIAIMTNAKLTNLSDEDVNCIDATRIIVAEGTVRR